MHCFFVIFRWGIRQCIGSCSTVGFQWCSKSYAVRGKTSCLGLIHYQHGLYDLSFGFVEVFLPRRNNFIYFLYYYYTTIFWVKQEIFDYFLKLFLASSYISYAGSGRYAGATRGELSGALQTIIDYLLLVICWYISCESVNADSWFNHTRDRDLITFSDVAFLD